MASRLAASCWRRRPRTPSTLLQVGEPGCTNSHATDPIFLYDIYCRSGGASVGMTDCMVTIHSHDVVGDNFWLWRADHGRGVGWTANKNQHRPDRQRQQRHPVRPVRRALPGVPDDLERQRRARLLLPVRDALRSAQPGGLAAWHGEWIRLVQSRGQRYDP